MKTKRLKPYQFRCQECGKDMESINMTAALAVMRRHRLKVHDGYIGGLRYLFTRIDGRKVHIADWNGGT